ALDFSQMPGGSLMPRVPVLSPHVNGLDRKSTRLNSSHLVSSYAVFCSKKKTSHGAFGRMLTAYFADNLSATGSAGSALLQLADVDKIAVIVWLTNNGS